MPFLVDFRLSPAVILYVTLLAVLAAVIAGVLPALKATGKRVQQGLQQFSVRGAGVQLGPTWTALIVLQVAVAVAVLPAALYQGGEFFRLAARRPAPAAHGLVRATLALSREGRALGLEKRLPEFAVALTQRLEADPDDRRDHVRRPVSRRGGLLRRSRSRARRRAGGDGARPRRSRAR